MFNDLRHASRALARSPAFTLIALLMLALGVGVNTSMYTLVDALLLRNVPFPESERMLSILGTSPRSDRTGFSFAEIEEMRAQAVGPDRAFESITAYSGWSNTYVESGLTAERFLSIDATADFFATFKTQPAIGRPYSADEQVPGRNRVALLSHRLWQTRFSADPDVIGRVVRLNAEQVEIIGVMPASFTAPLFFGPVDLWRPVTVPQHIVKDRNNPFFNAIGRLNPGVTPEQAHAQLAPLVARWIQDHPETNKDRGLRVVPPHKAAMDDTSFFIIWFMFAVGVVVLLIACANIANLQLARATANAKDLAIRSALGASRVRLITHQLAESVVLSIAGGVCGIAVAIGINHVFGNAIRLGDSGDKLELPLNVHILVGALGVALVTGLAFGLLPAWIASRSDVTKMLKQQSRSATSSRGARFLRHTLIVGEVAGALALLCAAGVMIKGLDALMHRDKGWATDRVIFANIHLPEQSTYASEEQRRIAIDKLARRLAEIPGAEHTGICTVPPTFGYSKVIPVQVEGVTSDDLSKQPSAGYTMIASDYLAAIGLPILQGRGFPENLTVDSPPVVIINETMAKRFWPAESAVGKRIGDRQDDRVVWREVIGVVPDIEFALDITAPSTLLQVYKPMVHEPWGYMNLVVSGPNPARFKADIRRAVADIDSDVAVQTLLTVSEAADRYQRNLRVVNNTIAGFAVLGLILAAVGLYGVISNLVTQRTSEFGIRLALGARPDDVLILVMRTGARLTLVGLVLGGVLAAGLIHALHASMPRMASFDLVVPSSVAIVLFAVAMFASWGPARRATRVDPLTALQAE